jgi:hypothetical protein
MSPRARKTQPPPWLHNLVMDFVSRAVAWQLIDQICYSILKSKTVISYVSISGPEPVNKQETIEINIYVENQLNRYNK